MKALKEYLSDIILAATKSNYWEYGLKAFFIRVMQVIWIVSVLVISGNIFSETMSSGDIAEALLLSLFWLIFLVVIQYLVFARIGPGFLFGASKGVYFYFFAIACVIASIIGGAATKAYQSHEYNKEVEEGSSLPLFDEILDKTILSYDLEECKDQETSPSVKREDLYAAVASLKDQQVKGLNILVEITKQSDKVGRATRCAIYNDIGAEGMAEIAGIAY